MAAHRQNLDQNSANIFEDALRQDDQATRSRFGHVNETARLQQDLQSVAVLDADIARAGELLHAARSDLQRINDQVTDTLRCMGLDGNMSPERLEAWLGLRDLALEALAAVRAAERDVEAAKSDGDSQFARLNFALDAAGGSHDPEASFEGLMIIAQGFVDQASETRQFRLALGDRERELADRKRLLEKATAEDRDWETEWNAVCSLPEALLPGVALSANRRCRAAAHVGPRCRPFRLDRQPTGDFHRCGTGFASDANQHRVV